MERTPPVAPLEPLLNFHPQSLAAGYEWFQLVCADVLRATRGFRNVEPVGVSGESQEGLDIRAEFGDAERWGFQCKQEREFGPGKVTEAIEAVPADPQWKADTYRIFLSREATDGARQRARQTPGWDIIDAADISRMIRAIPSDEGVDLVRRHFGSEWVERFFGFNRTRAFVAPDRFYRPFLDHNLVLNHDRPLRGRADDVARLEAWYNGTSRSLMLVGRLGLGVSKLLFEFATNAEHGIVVMPLAGTTLDTTALNEIPAGPVLIIVDDDEIAHLAPLLTFIAQNPEKRLIYGCEPQRERAIAGRLFDAGIGGTHLTYLRIAGIGRESTIAVARDAFPGLSEDLAESIVMHAADTPFATIVAARLHSASSTEAAIAIYLEATTRCRQLIDGHLNVAVPQDHVRLIFRIVAILGPVHANSSSLLLSAQRFGLHDDDSRRTISAIRAVGGFAERGDLISISPTVARDAILIDTFTNGNDIDPQVHEFYDVFGFEKRFLANMASANDVSQATGRPMFFDVIWERMLHDVMAMDNARRSFFVVAIAGVAPYKPSDVVRVCRNLYYNPPADDRQEFEAFGRISAEQVGDEISSVLGTLLRRHSEYAGQIVPLLWDIGATDRRLLNAAPSAGVRVLRDAVEFDGAFSRAQLTILEAIAELLRRTDLNESVHSPLEVIEPLIALQSHSTRSRGDHFELRTNTFALAELATLRDRAFELLIAALHSPFDRRALVASRMLSRILLAIAPYSNAPADVDRLRQEQDRVLDAFEVAAALPSTLRKVALRNELIGAARRRDEIGERIGGVIALLQIDDEAHLLRAIAPSLSRNWILDENLDSSGFTEHYQGLELERQAVAHRLLHEMPNVEELRDFLQDRTIMLSEAGVDSSLSTLLATIAMEDIEYAIELAQVSLDDTVAPNVSAALSGIIMPLLETRPEIGRLLLDEAQNGSTRMRQVAAAALQAPLQSADIVSDEVQHRMAATIRAMNDEQPSVRDSSRMAAARLATAVPSLASVLIEAFAGDDANVVEYIYAALSEDGTEAYRVDGATFERLARRLIELQHLAYHGIRFLATELEHHVQIVFEVIEARVRRHLEQEGRGLPQDPSLRPLIDAILGYRQVDAVVSMAVRLLIESTDAEYDLEYFIGELWSADARQVRQAVFERAGQATADEMRILPLLLGKAPMERLASDVELLVALVDGAYRCGYDVGETVGEELESALLHRMHVRTGRTNTEELVVLEAALDAALGLVARGSDSEHFIERLLQRTRQEMRSENRRDDEAFGVR